MLKEITINELFRSNETVYFLNTITGTIVPAEDLFQGIRILRDEVKKEEVTDNETTDTSKRKRRTAGEIQSAVIKAYDCGNRTITQVMEIAKVDYKTARRYIPMSKEG